VIRILTGVELKRGNAGLNGLVHGLGGDELCVIVVEFTHVFLAEEMRGHGLSFRIGV
jgi:hypothetical protein